MRRLENLYRAELSHRAISVYIYLKDRANKDGECWPAIPTIARELKLSQSTVRRALQDLRKAGFAIIMDMIIYLTKLNIAIKTESIE